MANPPPSTDPLVSVVIPAFNAERTLAETASSALASSYQHLELIIVDDGSTDRTAEIGGLLAETDPRVRIVQRSNGGLPAALNTGFDAARGDYVARLDADDVWHPDKLAHQMALARTRPEAAFIYTFFRYIDVHGRVVRDGPPQRFPAGALCRGIYEPIIGTGSSVVMKRSAVQQAGGCEEGWRTYEDLLLQLKISASWPIAFVPLYLVGYRVQAGSLSQSMDAMAAEWLQLDRHIRQLFPHVPRHVHDWGHARRCAEIAESFAWRGQYGRSASFLWKAIRHDPEWSLRYLQHRVARHVRRRLGAPRAAREGPRFFDADPCEPLNYDPHGAPLTGGGLARLEHLRLARLAALDERLAGDQASAP